MAFQNVLFSTPQAFAALEKRKKASIERRQLFATAEKVWSLSSMRRESSSIVNRNTHTHSHTHTHTHTQDDCYTLAANAYARVMTTKVLSTRPRIKCGETNKLSSTTPILRLNCSQFINCGFLPCTRNSFFFATWTSLRQSK